MLATHPHLGKCEGIPEQLALAHEVEVRVVGQHSYYSRTLAFPTCPGYYLISSMLRFLSFAVGCCKHVGIIDLTRDDSLIECVSCGAEVCFSSCSGCLGVDVMI